MFICQLNLYYCVTVDQKMVHQQIAIVIKYFEFCITTQLTLYPQRTEQVFHNSSHFHHWWFCCRYLGHCSLSVPPTWLFFLHGLLLLAAYLIRLKGFQVLVGLIQLVVRPLLTATGANKGTPLHVDTSQTHDIWFTARQMSQALSYPQNCGQLRVALSG